MTNPKAGGWIIGSAFIGIIILLIAWFVAISPTLSAAADTRTQVANQQNQNALAQVKIDSLKKQFTTLDATKAQLAAVQLQIPTAHDLATYQQQLAGIAAAHSVTVSSVQFSPAAAVVPLAATTAPSATATVAPNASTNAAAAPAATAPAVGIAGFYAVPSSIDIVGGYQNVLAFLKDLQVGTQRLFLVSAITATSQGKADASGGKPATNPGDLDLVVTGQLYVLANTTQAAASPAPAATATPPTLPVPDPAKNPFKPLG